MNTIQNNKQDSPGANQSEVNQQKIADEKDGIIRAVRSFFIDDDDEHTAVGSLVEMLQHWITSEYKDQCRLWNDVEMIADAETQLMRVISTIRLLSVLESPITRIETYEEQTGIRRPALDEGRLLGC